MPFSPLPRIKANFHWYICMPALHWGLFLLAVGWKLESSWEWIISFRENRVFAGKGNYNSPIKECIILEVF